MVADAGFCSPSSTGDSLKRPCDDKSYKLGVQEDHKGTLDSIWYKATELCQSNGLKTFLRKRGTLTSLCVNQGTVCTILLFLLCLLSCLLILLSSAKFVLMV